MKTIRTKTQSVLSDDYEDDVVISETDSGGDSNKPNKTNEEIKNNIPKNIKKLKDEDLGEYSFNEKSDTEEENTIEYYKKKIDELTKTKESIDNKDKSLLEQIKEMDSSESDSNYSKKEVAESKGFINKIKDFINNSAHSKDCSDLGTKYKIPRKKLADGFVGSVLGTIGDVLDVCVSCVEDIVNTTITLLTVILTKGAAMICRVARSLVRIFTLNKTCIDK